MTGDYEPPKLSIYESETDEGGTLVAWAGDASPSTSPDDTLKATPGAAATGGAAPEVLGWSAPPPEYEFADPAVFVAPRDPKRKVSGPKTVPKKTTAKGKKTLAHSTRTKLTGHDAFGMKLCACDLVCSCDMVCTCESVATCSCVAHTSPSAPSSPSGPSAPPCSCDTVCTCQGVSSCSCVSNTPNPPPCAVENQ